VSDGGASALPGTPGQFHGRPSRRLENEHCWIEVLSEGGPRIVGFGLRGEESALAETPGVSWDAGYGIFELLGGHRLWFAPESPECSIPDGTGLALAGISDGNGPSLRMTGAVQAPTGLRKTIEVRLARITATVQVRHILTNEGDRPLQLSPWPITQLKPGGTATVGLPEKVTAHDVSPNQLLVLWPYSSWTDDRLVVGERTLTVRAMPGEPFKVGCLARDGVVNYVRDGLSFTKSFEPALGSAHADMGVNLEIYCDQGVIELESLGPLVTLAPGESTTHDERWELHRVQ
jgi:hypothetical protein